MNPKTIKIIIIAVVLITLVGAGIGIYFHFNQTGQIVGRIKYGEYYHLTEIRPTERFDGATMSRSSYFRIKSDGKTGELYLKDLKATTSPIPLTITSYKEGTKHTVIEFEYLLNNGEKTKIQRLTAISTDTEIRIKAVESHDVGVIQQKESDISSLDYSVTILVFSLDTEEEAE